MTQKVNELTSEAYLTQILKAPVYDVAQITPLELMPALSHRIYNKVLAKREDRQIVHSFKLRGAYTMMANLTQQQRLAGVITASAGNHAQGVALAAQRLATHALILMPKITPEVKIEAVKALGGEVMLFGETFDETKCEAERLAETQKRVFIPPYDHPLVIAGQGTIGLELLRQDVAIDRVFIPIGGGGLAAGVALLLKELLPSIKVIGVEHEESAAFYHSLQQGELIALPTVGTFAEGVAVNKIGVEPYRLCRQYLDDVVTVNSDSICAAIKDIFDDTRSIAEPSGALALAGLKKYVNQHQIKNERLVHIVSGANVNFHRLRYISERCEIGEKKEALFSVIIPEVKGSFLAFCKLLGNRAITEFNYRYNDTTQAAIFVGVSLTQGDQERLALRDSLQQQGYAIDDLSDDEMAKLHIRYMVGGKSKCQLQESLYSFEFPEHPGALFKFLYTLGTKWNISLFHYRSHGTDYGRVLVAFEVKEDNAEFIEHLEKLGYLYKNETNNRAYRFFLAS